MTFPNTIIAGAPKCGTSSLFNWLQDHPCACGSAIKELFYLMDNGHPLARPEANFESHGLERYPPFFEACHQKKAKVVLEATTHYIYQQTAIDQLSSFNPQPHIIFLLREPAERVFSSFQYGMNNLACFKREMSFAEFLEAVENKSLSSLIREDAIGSAYVLERDVSYSRYINYLRLWLEKFDQSRLHIVLKEDLQKDGRAVLKGIATQLEIDPDFYDQYAFARQNETYAVSHKGVHRRLKKLGALMPQKLRRGKLKQAYLKAQSSSGRKISDDDKKTIAELKGTFAENNRELASTFGLDLSAWN